MSNSNEYDSESGPEWDYNESDSDAASQSEWEEDKSDEESDNEWNEVGVAPTTTTIMRCKRQREYDSASDTDETDSEDEKDENGNLFGLIIDDEEEIAEDNVGAAALDMANIVHSKRRRLSVDRFVAEPVQIEPSRSNKWKAFKEVADELIQMNKNTTTSPGTYIRYKTLLKHSIAETPSLSLAKSTGWFDAVKTMPQHRKLGKYKKRCFNKLHNEWVEEEKRLHAKKLAKIAELCVV